jgi:hypothetical protein
MPQPAKKISAEEFAKHRLPPPVKHPLRFAINGVKDKIPEMKKMINETELDDGLKAFICCELDKMTSNAAEVHLHDVERPDGGFDLHVSVKPVTLGTKPNAIFSRASQVTPLASPAKVD